MISRVLVLYGLQLRPERVDLRKHVVVFALVRGIPKALGCQGKHAAGRVREGELARTDLNGNVE
jgi:hypothetical protein